MRSLEELLRNPEPSVPPRVREALETCSPGTALFDADGTLWRGDISEDFARWMIGEGLFDAGLWDAYDRVNREDVFVGCVEILKFYRGHRPEDLADHVTRFWEVGPPRQWIASTTATLAWLASRGHACWVVSATPSPVLHPLKALLPITELLALDPAVHDHTYTGAPLGTPTIGPGKATRVHEATPTEVHLAAGNSKLDVDLLALAQTLAWAINPDPPLETAARSHGWLITRC